MLDYDIKRFWSKVNKKGKSDCWLWTGAISARGHGKFWVNGKDDRAHRFSFMISVDPNLTTEYKVLHTCENKLCVNPCHLYSTKKTNFLPNGNKICSHCRKEKKSQFYYSYTGGTEKQNLQAVCRDCKLRSRYNLEEGQYDEMLENQNFKCAICLNEFDKKLTVDHNHTTGQVRGLLCNNCNAGLGMFKDNKDTLASALSYLKKYDEPSASEAKDEAATNTIFD